MNVSESGETTIVEAPPPRGRWRRRLAVLAGIACVFLGGVLIFLGTCFATPPELGGGIEMMS